MKFQITLPVDCPIVLARREHITIGEFRLLPDWEETGGEVKDINLTVHGNTENRLQIQG